MTRLLITGLCLVALVWIYGQQPPEMPQQPLVIRDTKHITNVTISVTTTISEIQGIRVDGQFVPLRTNLMFRTVTNLWSMS